MSCSAPAQQCPTFRDIFENMQDYCDQRTKNTDEAPAMDLWLCKSLQTPMSITHSCGVSCNEYLVPVSGFMARIKYPSRVYTTNKMNLGTEEASSGTD